jgi:hypothetical protein
LRYQLCWQTGEARKKWANYLSKGYFSVRSFLSTSFSISNSKFRWVGSWCHPKKIFFFHIHGVSEMTTPRGVIGYPKRYLIFPSPF